MEFIVYSRPAFEAAAPHDVPHVVVSINCPGEQPAKFQANELTLGRVNLFFWDLDSVPLGGGMVRAKPDSDSIYDNPAGQSVKHFAGDNPYHPIGEDDLCQPVDAHAIVDLIDAHPEAQLVVVHCTAGKSRSAAVAASLMKCIEGDDSAIFNNPRYKPNMRVYRMVFEAWHDKHGE